MNERYFVYRIFYGNEIVYVGRTKQALINRMRAHMNKIDKVKLHPSLVSRIEYAECESEADMCLYEVYYINKWHPELNDDAKAGDSLTVTLPELKWTTFFFPELKQWVIKEKQRDDKRISQDTVSSHRQNLIYGYERRYRQGEINRETYEALVAQVENMK